MRNVKANPGINLISNGFATKGQGKTTAIGIGELSDKSVRLGGRIV